MTEKEEPKLTSFHGHNKYAAAYGLIPSEKNLRTN